MVDIKNTKVFYDTEIPSDLEVNELDEKGELIKSLG